MSLARRKVAASGNLAPLPGQPVPREKSDPSVIQSLEKGLSIFEQILAANRPLKLHEITSHFEMDKASAFRFLHTLERSGLVIKDSVLKTYAPGPKLRSWNRMLRPDTSLVEISRPFLKELSALTKQTSHLAVLQNDRVVFIEVMHTDNVVSVKQTAGDWEPLYCTAVGKAIIACLPEQERTRLIDEISFRQLTPATLTTPAALRAELTQAALQKVAFDSGENNPQLCCIAAPVFDQLGYPAGSVGISMIYPLFPNGPKAESALIADVSKIAQAITDAMRQRYLP